MLRIKLRYKWRMVKLNLARFLVRRAAHIDSKFIERFAYEYVRRNYDDFQDYCYQQLRNVTIDSEQ